MVNKIFVEVKIEIYFWVKWKFGMRDQSESEHFILFTWEFEGGLLLHLLSWNNRPQDHPWLLLQKVSGWRCSHFDKVNLDLETINWFCSFQTSISISVCSLSHYFTVNKVIWHESCTLNFSLFQKSYFLPYMWIGILVLQSCYFYVFHLIIEFDFGKLYCWQQVFLGKIMIILLIILRTFIYFRKIRIYKHNVW